MHFILTGFNPGPEAIGPSVQENWAGLVAMIAEIESKTCHNFSI